MALLMGDKVPKKDLLELEGSSSALERRLLVSGEGGSSLNGRISKRKEPTPIQAMPESSVFERLKSFLPALDQANRKLFADIKEQGKEEFDIEGVTDAEEHFIEMDLALGVADLHTPEALAAAEFEVTGRGQRPITCGEYSESSDDSEGDDEDTREPDDGILLKSIGSKKPRPLSGVDQDCLKYMSQSKQSKIELLN